MNKINLYYDEEYEKYENCNCSIDDAMYGWKQDITTLEQENDRLINALRELIRISKDIKQEAISQEPFSDLVGMNLMDEWSMKIEDIENSLLKTYSDNNKQEAE
jgi:hypothetical protein